jgi:hypothetical protein
MTFGNLRQIEANRSQWKRISRREAIEWCRRNRVVVVHREKGVDVVSVFSPQSRFFSGNGPYSYSTYQYFLDLGARQKDFVHNAAAGEKTAKPFDPFDASQYTPLDEVEPAKLYPIVFELTGVSGKPFPPTAYELTLPDGSKRTGTSGADGFIRHEFNRQPGQAKLKLLPGQSVSVLEPDSKRGNESETFPIEIDLEGGSGNVMAGVDFSLDFPDGTHLEGTSDSEGKIRFPENTIPGEAILSLREKPSEIGGQPEEEDEAESVALEPSVGPIPIDVTLMDESGSPLKHRKCVAILPNGERKEAITDAKGRIQIHDNDQTGEMEFRLLADSVSHSTGTA